MLVVGRRVIPWMLHYVAHTGSRELFRLAVLAIALGVAFGAAKLFGVSFALGAFFAGMILSESELSHRAAEESLPLRDAFAVLFFVSVGMLFDPAILIAQPLPVLATVLSSSWSASRWPPSLIVLRVRPPARHRADDLGEPGADRRVLLHPGRARRRLGLLPEEGRDLILAGAILSILLNPLLFAALDRLRALNERPADRPRQRRRRGRSAGSTPDDGLVPTKLADHTILVGYGRVGSLVGAALTKAGMPVPGDRRWRQAADQAAHRRRRDHCRQRRR